jgi:hypothetical protein
MRNLKHVGRIDKTNLNVLVAFRTLPGESNMALVIPTAKLSDVYHDAIMKVVESDQAQQSFEFGEILFARSFPDGRPMLQALRADGHLDKVPTDTITMLPTPHDNVALSQLNVLIAEQRNCTIDELCNFVSGAPKATTVEEIVEVKDLGRDLGEPARPAPVAPLQANNNAALSDTDIAKSYRSQADALYKEAALLRKQADDLDPPKSKKAAATKETASA